MVFRSRNWGKYSSLLTKNFVAVELLNRDNYMSLKSIWEKVMLQFCAKYFEKKIRNQAKFDKTEML